MKRYFYITIHFSPDYERTVFSKRQDDLYINSETGSCIAKDCYMILAGGKRMDLNSCRSYQFDGIDSISRAADDTAAKETRTKIYQRGTPTG